MTDARAEILQKVNLFTFAFHRHNAVRSWRGVPSARMYGRRHRQEAVFLARQRRLVSDEVLAAAGFNPGRPAAS